MISAGLKLDTYGVEDIEVLRQGVSTGCDGSIVRHQDGVVQAIKVRESKRAVCNVRHLESRARR